MPTTASARVLVCNAQMIAHSTVTSPPIHACISKRRKRKGEFRELWTSSDPICTRSFQQNCPLPGQNGGHRSSVCPVFVQMFALVEMAFILTHKRTSAARPIRKPLTHSNSLI